MIKIITVHIKRFRSILDIKLNIEADKNITTICGENNTGKTNLLRAINLFFDPQIFIASKDTPYHKYEATRGGAVYPEIIITFKDDNNYFEIKRKFDLEGIESSSGKKWTAQVPTRKSELTETETTKFLSKIAFFNVESINISFPSIINNLVEDLYDIEFARTRFSGLKAELKKSFDNYTKGLLQVLGDLADEIKPLFNEYKGNWGVGFDLQTDIKNSEILSLRT